MQQPDDDQPIEYITPDQPGGIPGWREGIPVIRLFTCGLLSIEILQEVPDGDPALARYEPLPAERLRGAGPAPACKLLKLLCSRPERYASKDWLMTHLREGKDPDQSITPRRLENIVSTLRKLVCLPSGKRLQDLLTYERATHESGDGYHLVGYPLVWVDADALAWNVKQACLKEQFHDDALLYWHRAYELASRGTFLLDEATSDWAKKRRREVQDHLRQSVHALARLLLKRYGESAEEEVIRILSAYRRSHPADEDLVRPLLHVLAKRGRYGEVIEYYESLERSLEARGLTKEGKERTPSRLTQEIVEYARLKLREGATTKLAPGDMDHAPFNTLVRQYEGIFPVLLTDTPGLSALNHTEEGPATFSHLLTLVSQGIILAAREFATHGSQSFSATTHTRSLHTIPPDLAIYEKNLRMALHIHRTSNAQGILHDVECDLHDLEYLEDQTRGDVLSSVRTLLVGNSLLATKIVKDQKHYALAYAYANAAVRLAKSLQDEALEATARYTRGCTKLEWGGFGTMKQGQFHPDHQKIQDAIRDFQAILLTSLHQPDTLHPQLLGSTQLQLSRAQQMLTRLVSDDVGSNALQLADQAADMIGRKSIEDPYTRMMMTGTLSGLHQGGYYLVKAGILNLAKYPDKAMHSLDQFKHLTEQTYGRDETRYQAWSDIEMTEALLGVKEYQEATAKAKGALIACHHIHSMQNIAMITDIYNRLLVSDYGTSGDVKELGDMLYEWYGSEHGENHLS